MPTNTFSDQKFLIVMVKDGGEDSYHTVLSRNSDHVAASLAVRPTIGFTQTELDSTYAAAKLEGSAFSLHPALQPLTEAWIAGDMAITHRVGPMVTDIATTPIEELRAATSAFYTGSIKFPTGMGAHDKQSDAVVSMITSEFQDSTGRARVCGESGFLGRLASRFAGYTGSSRLPISIVVGQPRSHSTLLGSHEISKPVSIPHVLRPFNRNFRRVSEQERALACLDSIMAETKTEPRMEFFRQSNLVMNSSVSFFQPITESSYGSFMVDADFPGTPRAGWRATLWTFARTIENHLRQPALHNRTVFIGTRSGYDSHSKQGKASGGLSTLHAEWSAAVMNFRSAMMRLGVWQSVVMMDHSEFGRTLRENGSAGTDHGYARDAFALGGAIRGRGRTGSTGLFGSYPKVLSAEKAGSNDLAGGMLSPGISLEQQWEAVLTWFGADSTDIVAALPRRSAYGVAVPLIN